METHALCSGGVFLLRGQETFTAEMLDEANALKMGCGWVFQPKTHGQGNKRVAQEEAHYGPEVSRP